jgi:hypothetical protein
MDAMTTPPEGAGMPERAVNYSQAYCSHCRVIPVRQESSPGYVTAEWWQCDSCATRFVPESRLAALEAERDYLTLCLGEANASKEAAHGEVVRIRAERDALREGLQRIAGGPAQEALCEGPTRRMEHIMGNCLHCKARAVLGKEGT